MSIIKEFKEFAIKGNMLDLAIGVVIGAAFGKIVSSIVNDIIMPPIGYFISGVSFTDIKILLKEASVNSSGKLIPAVNLNLGNFIQTLFDFSIIALTLFLVIKGINRINRKKKEETPPEPTPSEVLLTDIRDLLKNK